MKIYFDGTQDWQEVPDLVLPASSDFTGVEFLNHSNSANPNAPYSNVRVSFAEETPSRIRSVVAIADPRVTKSPPNGFRTSAQHAALRTSEVVSQSRNVPQGIKQIARELHPRDNTSATDRVSLATASIEIMPLGIVAQLHRAGNCKLFTFRNRQGWQEVLTGSVYAVPAQRRLNWLQGRLTHLQKKAYKECGPNSPTAKRAFEEYSAQEKMLLARYKTWACPPLGKFFTSSKLQKVKTDQFAGVDGILLSTLYPALTLNRLQEQGGIRDLNNEFFRSLHKGKHEFAASAIALSR